MNLKTIALMIRDTDRFDQCRFVTDQFGQAGTQIQVFALGLDPQNLLEDEASWQNCRQAYGMELYTDKPGRMEAYGFTVLDRARIAALIDQADVVIPL